MMIELVRGIRYTLVATARTVHPKSGFITRPPSRFFPWMNME